MLEREAGRCKGTNCEKMVGITYAVVARVTVFCDGRDRAGVRWFLMGRCNRAFCEV